MWGQLFAGCKLIGAPAPNQCQIITFLTLKTDTVAKLRIELKSILLEIPSNKIKGTNIGLNIFYFLDKYDNISIHCNLQITGSERKQEYLYSSSPEHIKFVKFPGRILNFQYKVY